MKSLEAEHISHKGVWKYTDERFIPAIAVVGIGGMNLSLYIASCTEDVYYVWK
jgi:hypothetical protein